jgi:hypothetical protein
VALARLQQPQAAQHVLESALASLDPEVIKTRPRLMAALATAHVRQGNTTKRVTLGPKPSTLPPASRSRPTSKTYDGYASTWSHGERPKQSRSWTNSSPLSGGSVPRGHVV